jgi:hypothetical protein
MASKICLRRNQSTFRTRSIKGEGKKTYAPTHYIIIITTICADNLHDVMMAL